MGPEVLESSSTCVGCAGMDPEQVVGGSLLSEAGLFVANPVPQSKYPVQHGMRGDVGAVLCTGGSMAAWAEPCCGRVEEDPLPSELK